MTGRAVLGVPGGWALLPSEDDTELSWEADAACLGTDPEAFFQEQGGTTRPAKLVCESCDVREQCLLYALANNERFGIWGGLSTRERDKLRKGRAS